VLITAKYMNHIITDVYNNRVMAYVIQRVDWEGKAVKNGGSIPISFAKKNGLDSHVAFYIHLFICSKKSIFV